MKRFTLFRSIVLSALMLTSLTMNAAEGALKGKFTVNANGDQVVFSQGNLQYQAVSETDGGTWKFADKQTTFLDKGPNIAISGTNRGWIDLFGWGTGDNPTNASTDNADYANFAEWGDNPIANGGNMPNQWRTLTADEWMYILHGRQDADQKLGIGTVNGVKGIILLPDVWETPLNEMGMPIVFYSLNARNVSWLTSYYYNSNKNNYELTTFSEKGWEDMEDAGAVFLPVTGLRTGLVMDYVSNMGGYHSSTKKDDTHAYYLSFNQSEIIPNGYCNLSSGYAVRLVQDCRQEKTDTRLSFIDVTGGPVRQMEAIVGEDFDEPLLTFETPVALPVTYSSTNENVATVDPATGEVTLIAEGSTSIIAVFAGNDNYNAARATYLLIVNKAETPVITDCPEAVFNFNGLQVTSLEIQEGEQVPVPMLMGVTGAPLTGSIRIENERVALVSADGSILGVSAGQTVMHVICPVSDTQTCDYTLTIVVTAAAASSELCVGGVPVTDNNKDDVLNDNGSVVYDPVSNTLTLTQAVVNGINADLIPGRNRTAEEEDINAAIRYTGSDLLTIVLVGANAILNADMGIYSEKAPVIIAGAVGAYGTARISGNIVAVKAEALKLYQCDVTASGSVGIAVDELGVANEAHLTAIGRSLAIQANTLLMTADSNIGILTAGVRFVPQSGFFTAEGTVALFVEIGKMVVPVAENEETTLDFTVTDPEGNESVIFNSTAQDKYNEETGQIELSSTLTDEQVTTAMETLLPGSSQWKESLPGSIAFVIPAGKGTIEIEGWKADGYELKLKMGNQPVVVLGLDESGKTVLKYDTPAAIYVVIYLHSDADYAPARIARVVEEDPAIGAAIRSIKITPNGAPTALDGIGADNGVNGKVLIDGQLFIIRNGKTYTATGVEVE